MSTSPIAQARRQAGLTQRKLAEERDVALSTVKRWEAGFVAPHGHHMLALEKRLGVTASDVLAFVARRRTERLSSEDAQTPSAA